MQKKFMLLIGLVAMQAVAFSAVPLAEARKNIDAVVEGKVSIASLIKQLSADDQVTFLADVNKAIADMPASIEEKAAKYLNLNHAALSAAKGSGNVPNLLAEVFATVPPEALTVINERFATDLLNRTANPNVTYTDAQYMDIATNLLSAIVKRTDETDNGSTRSAFAILMLIRASNGAPVDLGDKLIDMLEHEDARELAKSEWIPSALGKDGREQGYEPLLASADAGRRPDFAFVLVIAGPQYMESILEDLSGKNADEASFIGTRSPVLDAVENPIAHQIPTLEGNVFGGEVAPVPQTVPVFEPEPEPVPYNGQRSYIGQKSTSEQWSSRIPSGYFDRGASSRHGGSIGWGGSTGRGGSTGQGGGTGQGNCCCNPCCNK